MTEREKQLVETLLNYTNHYMFVSNKEPEANDVFSIAMLERDRIHVQTIRTELLGKTLS